MKNGVKGLVLIGLGFFLISRLNNGTIFFYINSRFVWLTLLAGIGFFLVAAGYLFESQAARSSHAGEDHDHADHDHHDHHDHSHNLSRIGLLLILLPIVLGTIIPPRPLGATAMADREVSVSGLSSAVAPKSSQVASSDHKKNLLDWLVAFDAKNDPQAFDGQEAEVVGFVYRDGRFADDTFMVSRFIVSCCVADATPIGLIVQWPDAASLKTDSWVEVSGAFQAGEFDGQKTPILVAQQVQPTDPPNQPYLFP